MVSAPTKLPRLGPPAPPHPRWWRYGRLTLVLAARVAIVACGADNLEGTPLAGAPPRFILRAYNRSQFELLAVRFGWLPVLENPPLALDAFVEGVYEPESSVEVERLKVQDGPRIRLTTAEPPPVNAPGFALFVFDTSFRLMAPGTVPGYDPPYPEVPQDGGPQSDGAPVADADLQPAGGDPGSGALGD